MPAPDPSITSVQIGREPNKSVVNWLLFGQELNEVYLLLDFISGRPDKHLSDLKDKIPKTDTNSGAAQMMSQDDVIEYISKLRYPPEGSAAQTSKDAALVLLVKDALNSIAYPARGMTIAYTTLFTNTGRYSSASRQELASLAYPTLVGHARWFRRINHVMVSLALAITVIAATLLWQVTYGVQLTARFEETKRNDTASAARVFDQINSLKVSGGTLPSYNINEICNIRRTGHAGGEKYRDQQQKGDVGENGTNGTNPPAISSSSIALRETSAIQQACADYAFRHAQLCVTVADFGAYAGSTMFKAIGRLLPVHEPEHAEECDVYFKREGSVQTEASLGDAGIAGATSFMGSAPGPKPEQTMALVVQSSTPQNQRVERRGRQEDAISIAGVLSVTSNYLLPILFGLSGSIVAVIRSIQNKINENVLVPRDRALTMIRLPLGMVAGVCVGLFLSPDDVSKNAAGLGGFTLSASGIAFLAGYGAEAFFRTLDAIVERIFALDDTAKRKI
ncbi:hypothetical protein ACFQE0_05010 [Methylobacterium komagatae]|uniref:Uncharacterized protein n=1 Tax=Methylobacterium komagatae TaxID=374425 RepID=A0ABW2BHJ8_9HYPH